MLYDLFSQRSGLGALDRVFSPLVPVLALVLLSGCSSVSYYSQLAAGQLQLLRARQPVEQLLRDPATDPVLRERLEHAEQARVFASDVLKLPDNRSYRVYADIGRPYVVWNVFATPELSLVPLSHCFPIAGCVAYRGFYAQGRARGAAALLREEGLDTYVAGIEAYSTLGWFADPILNTMLRWDDQRLAATLFHELAHQRLYVADDTAFNESFASFVEQQGLREWQASRGLPVQDGGRQRQQFTALVLASRARLEALYISPVSDAQKRAGKAAEFARLRSEYRQRRDREWAGDKRYDAWIEAPLNNARLLPFGLYDQWVAAFAALFRQVDGAWPAFYARAAELGELPQAQREQALAALAAGG